MADKPNGKLLNTTQNDDLSLTGKPALVQNDLGIFYGFLEKSDTRSGTALLRDGFRLSPDRHITFSQYLDFLSNEIDSRYWQAESKFTHAVEEAYENDNIDPEEYAPIEADIVPNEILISQDTFDEHSRNLSITDYASEGIFLVQKRTSTHTNSRHIQSSTPLISLTNVIAVVAISENMIEHPGMEAVKKEVEDDGLISEVGIYYDALTPLVAFGLISNNPLFMKMYIQLKDQPDSGMSTDEFFSAVSTIFPRITRSLSYITQSIPRQVRSYINKDLIKNDENLREFTLEYIETLTSLPALVVNSNQRVSDYQKKAQTDEQTQKTPSPFVTNRNSTLTSGGITESRKEYTVSTHHSRRFSPKDAKGSYVVETNELFYFNRPSADAAMKVVNGNNFVLLKGSRIDPAIHSKDMKINSIRGEHASKLVDNITITDIEFNSPSAAGEFVCGGANNGKVYWRTKDGRKLEEFIKYIA